MGDGEFVVVNNGILVIINAGLYINREIWLFFLKQAVVLLQFVHILPLCWKPIDVLEQDIELVVVRWGSSACTFRQYLYLASFIYRNVSSGLPETIPQHEYLVVRI